jgi:multidrug resistance efflux pump
MANLITHPDDIILQERAELNYFLGDPPSWMLRYGILVVLFIFGLLLFLSYLIKYPDTVHCTVVLTTEQPPIRVLAQASGRVSELLVKENESVQTGQILAVLENIAEWRDVLRLETMLQKSTPLPTLSGSAISIIPPNDLHLGTLQTIYSTFTQNAKDYAYFTTSNGVSTKIQHLARQIESLRALNQNLVKQKEIQVAESTLAASDFNRQKQLHTEGVISDLEFEKANTVFLQQRRQIEATEANFINNEMQIHQHESQISDLAQTKNDNQNTKQLTANEDTHRLLTAIGEWKRQNLVIAPIAGTITLSKIWSAKQAINGGDELLTVVPSQVSMHVVGKATMPIANSGKVHTGLPAKIQLDNFPYMEYGILEGTVRNIALVPQKENYLVEIALNDSLRTTYGKHIVFKQEIQGFANIITEDRRMIARIFDKFRDLIRNRV